jgi:transposase
LWAIDEVHFQQHGSRCMMWVPPEVKDPVLLHHPTRKKIGYFGAVRLCDGSFIYKQEAESLNAQSFWEFLKKLESHSMQEGRRIMAITDNAKYHHALLHKEWRESVASRFELAFLPPYSPELNPIERAWKLTRRLCLHNKYFPDLKSIVDTVENQFDKWSVPNDVLRRLCAI